MRSAQKISIHDNIVVDIIYTNRKNSVGFKIVGNKTMVYAPASLPFSRIKKIVDKKSGWIKKKFEEYQKYYSHENQIFFLGAKLIVKLSTNQNKYGFWQEGNELLFSKRNANQKHSIELLKMWYRHHAITYLTPRIKYLSNKLELFPSAIEFKLLKTQWGNCNCHKKIKFNFLIMILPKEVIDYVIIHELCHLKEMNHSIRFWSLVKKYCNDYKDMIKILKEFSLHNVFNLNLELLE